jgi:3-phosphoshikimate 1-carboxyvinyltransferase
MRMTVQKSSLSGSLRVPPSKSYTHRALFCSALAQGESTLRSPLSCDDTRATSDELSRIGVATEWGAGTARVTRSGELKLPSDVIMCGESGTTLRFMTAICATTPHDIEISGEPSLLKRPVKDLAAALGELGAHCTSDLGYPPVHVKGPIKGGSITIPGNVSSQYVSAVLLAAPLAEKPVEVKITERLESKAYVQMTLDMQRDFGVQVEANDGLTDFRVRPQAYRASEVEIEGDWSSAAFLLAGATIAGDKVSIRGLDEKSRQADRCILSIIELMKAQVKRGSDSITTQRSQLQSGEFDVSDSPDLFPVICALCAAAHGTSTIKGIRRLRIKESNRVQAMSEGLRLMGIQTQESQDTFTVQGGKMHEATIDPHRDHRIAMAFALLGLLTGEVTIVDAECVGKSYPSFWYDIQLLGASVREN